MIPFRTFLAEVEGEEAVEYGLLASLIILAIIGAVTLFANNATTLWTTIAAHLST